MKRFSVLLAVALAIVWGGFATSVSPADALAVANAWAAENVSFGAGGKAVSAAAVCDTNAAKTVLWYQVALSGGGCLMVAPVQEIEPIVAALEKNPGTLPAAHPLRAILTADMRKRLRFLGLYAEDNAVRESAPQASSANALLGAASSSAAGSSSSGAAQAEVARKWGAVQSGKWSRLTARSQDLQTRTDAQTGLADLATQVGIVDGFEKDGRFTHWNQEADVSGKPCYNLYAPDKDPCGCVATAMAAVMQFFAAKGVCGEDGEVIADASAAPSSSKCTKDGASMGTLSCIADESGNFAYDWSLFDSFTKLDDYKNMTDEQRELLGRVTYNAGVMVDMSWTADESNAFSHMPVNALRDAFGFKDARFVTDIEQAQYDALIYRQCWAGSPVMMAIEGHEVVAVGYGKDGDGVDRVRVFLGWGGLGDAWYALPYIDTKSIPGGSTYLSDVITDVITMISRDDQATYPVCGQLIPCENAEVTCNGVTARANDAGYFGFRVAATTEAEVSCKGRSVTVTAGDEIQPDTITYSDAPTCKYAFDAAALAAEMPDPFLLLLLNSECAATVADATEKALAADKPIFMFSGTSGTPASDAVWSIVTDMDDNNTDDFTNKFVVVYFPYNTSYLSPSDGDPSYGVFDPHEIDEDDRWAFFNGRLTYNDVATYATEVAGGVTNNVATAETRTALNAVLDDGLKAYRMRYSNISLAIETDTPEALASTLVTDAFVAGETFVTNVPTVVTNFTAGYVYGCTGYVVVAENLATGLAVTNAGAGASVTLEDMATNTSYTLTWCWQPERVLVSGSVEAVAGGAYVPGTVTPEYAWATNGETVVFEALPDEGYQPGDWYVDGVKVATPDPRLTFDGKIKITAASAPCAVTMQMLADADYFLTVAASPAALTVGSPTPSYGKAYQHNDLYAAAMANPTQTVGEVTWVCTGWKMTIPGGDLVAQGSGTNAAFVLQNEEQTLTWIWQIDAAATFGLTAATDPAATGSKTLALDGVPADEVSFVNVPVGWELTTEGTDGELTVSWRAAATAWTKAYLNVDLTLASLPDRAVLTQAVTVATNALGQLVMTVPPAVTNFEEGVVYEPVTWTLTGSVAANGIGTAATIPELPAYSAVTQTWTWVRTKVRVTAAIRPYDFWGNDVSVGVIAPTNAYWLGAGERATFAYVPDHSPDNFEGIGLAAWACTEGADWQHFGTNVTVTANLSFGPVAVTAVLDNAANEYGFTVRGDPAAYGTVSPAYGAAVVTNWNDLAVARVAERIVAAGGKKWECTGWSLEDKDGVVVASGDVTAAGDAGLAEYRLPEVAQDPYDATAPYRYVFVWHWEETGSRDPAVAPEGPAGTSALQVGDGATTVNIANTVANWWYGLYSKTNLADQAEAWKYEKGANSGSPATNLLYSIEWDAAVPQKFFKIIVTEDEPEL